MKIGRKKAWNSVLTFVVFLVSVFILVACAMGIFSEKPLFEKVGSLIFLIISIIGLKVVFNSLNKIFSDYPEFELTTDCLVIYDDSYYDRIPFSEMLGCEVHYPRRSLGY